MGIFSVILYYSLPYVFLLPLLYLITFKVKRIFLAISFGNMLWVSLLINLFVLDFNDRLEDLMFYINLLLPLILMSVTLSLVRVITSQIKLKKDQKTSEIKNMEIYDL